MNGQSFEVSNIAFFLAFAVFTATLIKIADFVASLKPLF